MDMRMNKRLRENRLKRVYGVCLRAFSFHFTFQDKTLLCDGTFDFSSQNIEDLERERWEDGEESGGNHEEERERKWKRMGERGKGSEEC